MFFAIKYLVYSQVTANLLRVHNIRNRSKSPTSDKITDRTRHDVKNTLSTSSQEQYDVYFKKFQNFYKINIKLNGMRHTWNISAFAYLIYTILNIYLPPQFKPWFRLFHTITKWKIWKAQWNTIQWKDLFKNTKNIQLHLTGYQ